MRKICTVVLLLGFAVFAFAGGGAKVQTLKFDKSMKITPIVDGDKVTWHHPSVKRHRGQNTNAFGPGKFLMLSTYDFGSNGNVHNNLVDYEDGILVFCRMGATQAAPGTGDRGSWWAVYDGTAWSTPIKVETARRGWTDLSALADGSSVIVSHVANEVNIDAGKGFGSFTSTITGDLPGNPNPGQWPVVTVAGADNIVVCATNAGDIFGVAGCKQIALSTDKGATWTHQALLPDTTVRKPAFGADDQAIDSYQSKVAVIVAEFGGDIHLWQSADAGATWAYTNLTNYPGDIPVGSTATRPYGNCDVIYDNNGNPHIFWETVLASQDTAGTDLEFNLTTTSPIIHWSQASGFDDVVSFAQIPNAAQDNLVFAAGAPSDQVDANLTLTGQLNAGIDKQGNIHAVFAAFRPTDIDAADSTHYTDIYGVVSGDGGNTWSAPVNLTNTPQSEDLWPSLADNVGDSLRIIYQSDGSTGGNLQGGGANSPARYLYYAVPRLTVAVNEKPLDRLPSGFALRQNYPNPFNPSTHIDFDLPKAATVKLAVYDVAGKLVATLVDGKMNAGTHSVTWNADKTPSGVYFTKLETESFSSVKKMVLMK
jgi:hypothetical protein